MRVTSIRAQAPDGDLLAWELLAVREDGSEVFVGQVFESEVDFDSMTLTIGGDTFEVSLTQ